MIFFSALALIKRNDFAGSMLGRKGQRQSAQSHSTSISHIIVGRAAVRICASFTCLSLVSTKCSFEFYCWGYGKFVRSVTSWMCSLHTGPGPGDPPVLLNVKSRVMSILWQQPVKRNRTITHYHMYWHGRLYFTASGNVTNCTVVHLHPHTAYQLQAEACTSKGCSKSPESHTVWTLPGTPEGIPSPELFYTLQHLSLYPGNPLPTPMTWLRTLQTRDERRIKGKEEIRSLETLLRSHAMKFTDNDPALSPWTQYEYRVLGSSLNGGTRSSCWVEVTTRSSRSAGRASAQGLDAIKVRCWAFWLLCPRTDVGTYPECVCLTEPSTDKTNTFIVWGNCCRNWLFGL